MGLMLALMQLSALSMWGLWCYEAESFITETASMLDHWMESDYAFTVRKQEKDNPTPVC